MDKEKETIDDWPPILKNGYPFIYEGMTPAEYDEEKRYWIEHYQEYIDGTYVPLWKQGQETTRQ